MQNKQTNVLTLRHPTLAQQPIALTASQLEYLFVISASKKRPPTSLDSDKSSVLATQVLMGFDERLDNAVKVMKFLKSHGGKVIMALIEQDLAEAILLNERRVRNQAQEDLQRQRAIGHLLLGLLYREEAYARYLQGEELATEAKLKTSKSTSVPAKSSHDLPPPTLRERLDSYKDAIDAIDKKLITKEVEHETLKIDLAKLDDQLHLTTKKYQSYDTFLDTTFQELAQLLSASNSDESLTTAMEKLQLDMKQDSRLLGDKAEGDTSTTTSFHDDLNRSLFNALKLRMMSDILAEMREEKVFFNPLGERTKHLHEARWITPAHEKIVVYDNKYHLLKNDEKFDPQDTEQLERTSRAYLENKPRLRGHKNVKEHQQKEELKDLHTKKQKMTSQFELVAQEMFLLNHKKTLMRAAVTSLMAKLEPKNTPDKTNVNSYILMLESMSPKPNRADLAKLKKAVRKNQNIPQLLRDKVNLLTAGVAITDPNVLELLKRMRAELVSNPANTYLNGPKPNPTLKVPNPAVAPAPNKKPTAPTPFSTTPRPNPYDTKR